VSEPESERTDTTPDGPAGRAETPTVALDTSVLMAPVEANLRLFEELDRVLGAVDPVVPSSVLQELDRLGDGSGEAATAASVGRDLAARARPLDTGGTYADDALVELAAAGDVDYVATADRELVRRVLDADTPVLCLRGRETLAVTDP